MTPKATEARNLVLALFGAFWLVVLCAGCASRGLLVACAAADVASSDRVTEAGVEGNPLYQGDDAVALNAVLKGLLVLPLMKNEYCRDDGKCTETPKWLRVSLAALYCGGAAWNMSL